MKGRLDKLQPQKMRFPDIPVGAWFIYSMDLNDKEVSPYLKVSDTAAFSTFSGVIYNHPGYFPPDCDGYVKVRPVTAPTWGLA
jgi:hypothetical protein